jgi:lipid-binding SYLF domain-containing protein
MDMFVVVAIGPIGRNVEAAGVAAFKHVAAVYSYSKTRGFFAGKGRLNNSVRTVISNTQSW